MPEAQVLLGICETRLFGLLFISWLTGIVSAAARLEQWVRITATWTSDSSTACCRWHQLHCQGLASLHSAAVLAACDHTQEAACMLLP